MENVVHPKMIVEYPPDGGMIFYCSVCGRTIAYNEENKREVLQQGDFNALHSGNLDSLPNCDFSVNVVIE